MPVKSTSNRSAVTSEIDRMITRTIERDADQVLRHVQELYRQPKSGRLYRIGKTPTKADRRARRRFRTHQASAPGEAPAIDTAALSKGTTRTHAQKIAKFRWAVGLGVTMQSGRSDVALWLEFGTRRIRPRPAWRVALEVFRSQRSTLRT